MRKLLFDAVATDTCEWLSLLSLIFYVQDTGDREMSLADLFESTPRQNGSDLVQRARDLLDQWKSIANIHPGSDLAVEGRQPSEGTTPFSDAARAFSISLIDLASKIIAQLQIDAEKMDALAPLLAAGKATRTVDWDIVSIADDRSRSPARRHP